MRSLLIVLAALLVPVGAYAGTPLNLLAFTHSEVKMKGPYREYRWQITQTYNTPPSCADANCKCVPILNEWGKTQFVLRQVRLASGNGAWAATEIDPGDLKNPAIHRMLCEDPVKF